MSPRVIDRVKERGAKNIRFVCLIAAQQGVERVRGVHPDVRLWTGPSTIDSMSEGSLSRVWEMPAIAPTAQNRRAPSSSRQEFRAIAAVRPPSLNCLETT